MFPRLSKEQPMKTLRVCGLVFLVLCLASSPLQAANQVTNNQGMPTSPAGGQVIGSGAFAPDNGWQCTGIRIYALPTNIPAGGSVGYQSAGQLDVANQKWSAMVSGVAAGNYNVYIEAMFTNNSTGKTQYVYTSPVQVMVAAGCGCEGESED
jgi:hypothetical protein